MATRIVTFVGTGNYQTTRYRLDGTVDEVPVTSQNVRTAQVHGPDCYVVIVGTEKARAKHVFSGSPYFDEISAVARAVAFYEIGDGRTEPERWQIFLRIVELLDPAPLRLELAEGGTVDEPAGPDCIVLDITHGYRSQPFFAASAVAFAKAQARREQKELNVRILYGAYDPERRESHPTDVWDLTQLIEVLGWTSAIDAFMRFGRADDLAMISKSQEKKVRRDLDPGLPSGLSKLGETCRLLADDLATARFADVVCTRLPALSARLSSAKDDVRRWAPPLAAQMETLSRWTRSASASPPVSVESLGPGIQLVFLYLELERYSEAVATLRELLVTAWTVATLPPPWAQPKYERRGSGDPLIKKQRERVERELNSMTPAGRAPLTRWESPSERELLTLWDQVRSIRNDTMHCGFNSSARDGTRLRRELAEKARKVEELITGLVREQLPWSERLTAQPGSFVNLSNHPVSSWPEEQLRAAEAAGFGPPLDVPGLFPTVDPGAAVVEIEKIATETVRKVLEMNAAICHVAGEFTLAFSIVARLQGEGVRCVAATTARAVKETAEPEGTIRREAVFRFHGWRDYPLLAKGGD